MSDMSIPGVSGDYDKYIEALMKVERIPRDTAAASLEKYELERSSWRAVNKLSNDLKTVSKSLYSFNNPFVEKIVESTNEKAITATAKRDAKEQSFKLKVNRIATGDSFLSSSIEKNMTVPAGKYTFLIGEKSISFNWRGGRYRDFVELINKRGKDVLSVSEVKTTSNTVNLLFKSEVQGENNRLEFADDALTFALENGIIKKNDSTTVSTAKTSFITAPQSSEKVAFSETVKARDSNILEIELSVLDSDSLATNDGNADATSGIFEQLGSIDYKGIVVTNEPSETGVLPKVDASNTANASASVAGEKVDMNVLSLESTRGVLIPVPPISNIDGKQVVRINLEDYGNVKGLVVNNANTNKSISVESIRIFDPKAHGDYIPANSISVAQDAEVEFEGIKIRRNSNDIDDLVPGLTLHLHEETEKSEKIDVKPDRQLVKNSIIEFVAKYNRLLAEINILTQDKSEILEELTYFTDEEMEQGEKKLGLMRGDSTLNGLKNSLRMKTSAVYKTSPDSNIILLSNLGISTKSEKGGSIQSSRLRGYLEIDEKELDTALENNMEDVRHFFGFDSNGDILIDSGLAFEFDEQITPYVERGGIFATRGDSLNNKIASTEKKVEEYDKKLAQKEAQLRQKYAAMEGTLKNLKKQSDKIKGFTQPANGNN